MNLKEDIKTAFDTKISTLGVFIDLKQTLRYNRSWTAYSNTSTLWLRAIVLEWLKSYLQNRKQNINYENTNSMLSEITCGVPKVSILGPKLFILYVNDICNASDILQFLIFAEK